MRPGGRLRTAGLGQHGGQRRRLHAGRPQRGVGVDARRAAVRRDDVDAKGVDADDASAHAQLDAESLELLGRRSESWSPNVAKGSLAPVEQQHPDRRRIEVAELAGGSARASSRTCPASSTPVGPAPTMTIVSHRSRSTVSDGHLGHLERAEDAPTQLQRVVDGLHARRVPGELVVTEVRLGHAGGDDQAVVRQLESWRSAGLEAWTIRASRSKPVTSASTTSDVAETPHDVTHRRRDLTRRQHAGRHLVQQRLEEMVVAAIDQGDVDGLATESRSRADRRNRLRRRPRGDVATSSTTARARGWNA